MILLLILSGDGGLTATVDVTDAADGLAATAELEVRAAAAVQDAGDVLAATAALELRGAAALVDAGDAIVATLAPERLAVVDVVDAGDTLAAAAALRISAIGDDPLDLDPGDAGADIDDAPDTLAATGALEIRGAAALLDASDAIAATLHLEGPITATLDLTDAADGLAATLELESEAAPAPAPTIFSAAGGAHPRMHFNRVLGPATELPSFREKQIRPPRRARVLVFDEDDALVATATIADSQKNIGRRRALPFLLLS